MPKKRNHGDGGLYYDKNKKLWRGVVDVGFWPDGKRRQKAVTSRSQTVARQKLNALRDEIATHGAPLDKQTTLEHWAATWLSTVAQETYTPNALAAAESVTRTWIVPAIGAKKVSALKPSDVRAVVKGVTAAGRATATARKAYDTLSRMLETARREGLTARNVAEDVDAPQVLTAARGALTTQQAAAVLRASDTNEGTRWWVTLLVGLRQAERLGAQLADLDLDAGTLEISWTLDEITSMHGCGDKVAGAWPCGKKQGAACPQSKLKVSPTLDYIPLAGRLCLKRPKSGKARTVALIPEVVASLRRYVDATEHLPNPYGLIWRHEDGSPILPGEDQQDWRELLFRAGVITADQAKEPRYRPEGTPEPPTTHWARHTAATVMMELGYDAKVIGEIIGHVDVKTTQRYQHVSSAAARAAADGVGEHYRDALTS